MILDAETGERIRLPGSCLLVFLDETGEESLSDPNYPLFGLGGCLVTVERYQRLVNIPWTYMMGQWFGGEDKIFHSVDYSGGRGTPDQYAALVHYFTRFAIGRIASVVSEITERGVDMGTYELVSKSLFERFRGVEHDMLLRKFILPKSSGECGLQVADAIVNTVGGQVRARRKGAKKPNKDYEVVFGDLIDPRWKSYMEITRVVEGAG
jgi:hypothetical protein